MTPTALPPHSLDIERAALGCLLLDPEGAAERMRALSIRHFYGDAHRLIFRALERCLKTGKGLDPVSVAEDLRAHRKLVATGDLLRSAN